MFKTFIKNSSDLGVLLIRLMVGTVFLSEGIQKLLFPTLRGAGRFIRYAAVPLIVIMLAAIGSTKIPILINQGFWEMAHAARTDWSMLLGSLFLLINGSGKYTLNSKR